jgi:hypothetical protein
MQSTIQKRRRHLTVFEVATVLLLTASPMLALTPVSPAKGCAQTLNTAGEYILTGDLHCSDPVNGINITASNVIFHLAGHTISSSAACDSTKAISGIAVPSGVTRVEIEGGTVSRFNDGILIFSSHSVVRGIYTTGACFVGLEISGQTNRVVGSVVTASLGDGIGIGSGTGIVITRNDISGNFRAGVDISNFSNNNSVVENIINHF